MTLPRLDLCGIVLEPNVAIDEAARLLARLTKKDAC
eukprot:CAMPEP_0185757358 /NCGR_PEP_ID=MMETSP1174-20130828/15838_1 /TAXON_ID=35687 /ORGANISM="Dictyocha speculum, Strain CCMP1381" /LENGTH=35 /DNA_ID= /DNA_START= /DNA_END= /DNA_ORIENTATION=